MLLHLLVVAFCWVVTDSVQDVSWHANFRGPLTAEWTISETEAVNGEFTKYNTNVDATSYVRNGSLVLSVRPQEVGSFAYYAPRLVSKKTFALGSLKVTARIPKRMGLWPLITLQPEAGTPCRYTDDDDSCSLPSKGGIEILQTANNAQQFPYVLRTLHAGRHTEPSKVDAVLSTSASPERVPDFWWSEAHSFEIVRNTSGIYWFVDDELKQQVTATELDEFLKSNGNRPLSYGTTRMAPFDDSNALNLILSLGVGGTLPCHTCGGCCPSSRGTPIANSSINHKPYMEMVIQSIEFTELAGSAPARALRMAQLHATFLLVSVSGILLALWGVATYSQTPKADTEPRNAEVWLFQKHSDALIYGTSMGAGGGLQQSFSSYSQLGTSPYTSSIPDNIQMGQTPSVFRWGQTLGQ